MSQRERRLEIYCLKGEEYTVFLDGKEITRDIYGLDLSLRWDSVPEATLHFRSYPVKVQGKFQIKAELEGRDWI